MVTFTYPLGAICKRPGEDPVSQKIALELDGDCAVNEVQGVIALSW